jgi:hypothetical protein
MRTEAEEIAMHQTLDNLLDGFGSDASAEDCVHSIAGLVTMLRAAGRIAPPWPIKHFDEVRDLALESCSCPPANMGRFLISTEQLIRKIFGDAAADEMIGAIDAVAGHPQALLGTQSYYVALGLVLARNAIRDVAAAPFN